MTSLPPLPSLPSRQAPTGFRGVFRDDAEARAVYAEAAGIGRIVPRGVAVPADGDDVAALVCWAAAQGAPLVPRGSGSSVVGGAIGDGVIVDLGALAAHGPIDAPARRVWCGAAVVQRTVDRAARAIGLRFPVDPSSSGYCTVGGMAGTNAAGAHSLRFGAMRPWVTALDCVFADGTRATVRRGEPAPETVPAVARFLRDVAPDVRRLGATAALPVRKNSSGYAIADYARSGDLVDLLVGSEGTLAIFVGVELALVEAPGATASVLALFPRLEEAMAGAAASRDAGAGACELLDRTFLDVAAQGGAAAFDPGIEAALLVELEGADAARAAEAARALADRLRHVGAAEVRLGLDPAAERALWELRHAASPILARLDPRLKSMQFIEDGAVPPDRLPEYVRGVRASLARHEVRGVIFGHAGDANVHVNPLVDVTLPDWRGRMAAVLEEVVALTASLGGTLAGEHGDGRVRAPLLARIWGAEAVALFRRIKDAFDPAGILNPGVKLARAGDEPLGAIKYDPALPALPAAARRALDAVSRDRAYATSRLALLASAVGE